MKERGILFQAPLVRAILAGNKTQTRRLVKNPPAWWSTWSDGERTQPTGYVRIEPSAGGLFIQGVGAVSSPAKPSPYGVPGDRLWVRETWGLHRYGDPTDWHRGSLKGAGDLRPDWELQLRADWGPCQEACFWRPAIFMPRWASRLTLEVTEIRAQRLQDISEDDARAEGVKPLGLVGCPCEGDDENPGPHLPACAWSHLDVDPDDEPHRAAFAVLWDAINGSQAPWASNPWLWCVSFRRLP